MSRCRVALLAGTAALALAWGMPAAAQQPRAPVPATETQRLTAAQLDALLEPYAGAPQEAVGLVLDAARYPADLMAASAWAAQPEADRGPVNDSWPPPVKVLAERAPRTLAYLTENMASTAALGAAYATQPNDVWLAYGRVTARAEEAARPAEQAPQAAQQQPPAAQQQQQPAAEPAPAAAAPAPVAAAPATTTVVQTESGMSTTGTAIVAGAVGIGAGLLLGELFEDDDDDWGYGYGGGYYPPPPYYPGGSVDRGAAQERQEQRQEGRTERQEQRQDNRGDRQEQRPDRPSTQPSDRQGAGAARRADATAGQRAPLGELGGTPRPAAATARPAATQRPAATERPAVTPRTATQPTRTAPQRQAFGPAAGVDNRAAAQRSRSAPSASQQRAAPQRSAAPSRSGGGGASRGGGGGGRR